MATINGDNGDNILDGQRFRADIIKGLGGNDTLNGFGGDDELNGGKGVDTILGGFGNDTLIVKAPDELVAGETYDGGGGFDTLQVGNNLTAQNFFNFIESEVSSIERIEFVGDGFSRAIFDSSQLQDAVAIDFQAAGASSLFVVMASNDLDASGWSITGGLEEIVIDTTKADDTVVATNRSDQINIRGGVDEIRTGGGDDLMVLIADTVVTPGSMLDGGRGTDELRFGADAPVDLTGITIGSLEVLGMASFQAREDRSFVLDADQFGFGKVSQALDVREFGDTGNATIEVQMAGDSGFSAEGFTFRGDTVGAATAFHVAVIGDGDAETVSGSTEDDFFAMSGGTDTVNGGKGADQLTGGLGADDLTGGAGRDIFIYETAQDSGFRVLGGGNRDTIQDFKAGTDTLDMQLIDANALLDGEQAFAAEGNDGFQAGEFRIVVSGEDTIISFNLDGDTLPEMQILLVGVNNVTAADLIL